MPILSAIIDFECGQLLTLNIQTADGPKFCPIFLLEKFVYVSSRFAIWENPKKLFSLIVTAIPFFGFGERSQSNCKKHEILLT